MASNELRQFNRHLERLKYTIEENWKLFVVNPWIVK